jgi:uncharacterized protein YdaT
MNIQPISGYNQSNTNTKQISFKEADFIEDYQPTPYEKEMDSLYRQTQNQIELMKYFHKDNPARMKKEVKEITNRAFKQAEVLKAKYLKPKNFFQKLFRI